MFLICLNMLLLFRCHKWQCCNKPVWSYDIRGNFQIHRYRWHQLTRSTGGGPGLWPHPSTHAVLGLVVKDDSGSGWLMSSYSNNIFVSLLLVVAAPSILFTILANQVHRQHPVQRRKVKTLVTNWADISEFSQTLLTLLKFQSRAEKCETPNMGTACGMDECYKVLTQFHSFYPWCQCSFRPISVRLRVQLLVMELV